MSCEKGLYHTYTYIYGETYTARLCTRITFHLLLYCLDFLSLFHTKVRYTVGQIFSYSIWLKFLKICYASRVGDVSNFEKKITKEHFRSRNAGEGQAKKQVIIRIKKWCILQPEMTVETLKWLNECYPGQLKLKQPFICSLLNSIQNACAMKTTKAVDGQRSFFLYEGWCHQSCSIPKISYEDRNFSDIFLFGSKGTYIYKNF